MSEEFSNSVKRNLKQALAPFEERIHNAASSEILLSLNDLYMKHIMGVGLLAGIGDNIALLFHAEKKLQE